MSHGSSAFPDMKGRYFLLPFLDAWTNVFQVPGARTTGTQAQTFLITGPKWTGHGSRRDGAAEVADEHGMDAPGASTAPVRLKTTRKSTRYRISLSCNRSAPGAKSIRRRPGKLIRPST